MRCCKAEVLVVAALGLAARAGAQAPAAAPETLAVVGAESSLTYHLVHKMHKVDGVSKKIEGKAQLLPDGRAKVSVRVPVESFDSGNTNRDAHMKEAVEAARFPMAEVNALGEGLSPPATFPTTQKKTFKVQLNLHGIKQILEVPVELVWKSATRIETRCTFRISLDGFKVERPSLLFVKVDDELTLDAKLVFQK